MRTADSIVVRYEAFTLLDTYLARGGGFSRNPDDAEYSVLGYRTE